MKTFPVLLPYGEELDRLRALGCPRSVPWSLVAPHEQQALDNHDQSLKRLAERGGLSPAELLCVLDDTGCERVVSGELTHEQAVPELVRLIEEHAAIDKVVGEWTIGPCLFRDGYDWTDLERFLIANDYDSQETEAKMRSGKRYKVVVQLIEVADDEGDASKGYYVPLRQWARNGRIA